MVGFRIHHVRGQIKPILITFVETELMPPDPDVVAVIEQS